MFFKLISCLMIAYTKAFGPNSGYRNLTLYPQSEDKMYYADCTFGTHAGTCLIDINSPYMLVVGNSCTTCSDYNLDVFY